MSECSHNCSECAKKAAGECKGEHDFRVSANAKSHIRKVVAVMSGKGGVGKSLVTELLAVGAAKNGLKVAVLDADITGPSIPTAFGLSGSRAVSDGEGGILPSRTTSGIGVMSLNLLVDNPSDPVVWRGPVIAGAVKQFWSDVVWGDVDVMFVDLPPGTGDVPLTVLQSLPVAGVVIVTSPQDLVSMIVEKAVRMADMMKVPVLGIVENMSAFKCPDCGKVHRIFGEGKTAEIAARHGVTAVATVPIDPELAKSVDAGAVEYADTSAIDPVLKSIAE